MKYNVERYNLHLVEKDQRMHVIDLADDDKIVDTLYIGPQESACSICYEGLDMILEACEMPEDYDEWPLTNYDFIRNRNGGILAVDIRDVKIDGRIDVVMTMDLTQEGARLILKINDRNNLCTHFSTNQ